MSDAYQPPPQRRRDCRNPAIVDAVLKDFPHIPRHRLQADVAARQAEGMGAEILVDPSGRGYTFTGL